MKIELKGTHHDAQYTDSPFDTGDSFILLC